MNDINNLYIRTFDKVAIKYSLFSERLHLKIIDILKVLYAKHFTHRRIACHWREGEVHFFGVFQLNASSFFVLSNNIKGLANDERHGDCATSTTTPAY